MTTFIAVTAGPVGTGDIRFYDTIQPPLPAADYELEAKQEILDLPDGAVEPYVLKQALRVDGPRFSIDPASIHMLYPGSGQTGLFHGVLPFVVFGSFALPWARSIDPGAQQKEESPPWMGLLTLYQGEVGVKTGEPLTLTAGQVVHPGDPAILGPMLPGVTDKDSEKTLAIDMDLPFFLSVGPKLTELHMLAHAREVNTDHKPLLGLEQDGCFSVVMSNRVVADGAMNTVYLVSLEGHQNHLPGSANPPPSSYTKIRLVVLGSWTFQASASPGSFLMLIRELCKSPNGGISMQMIPPSEITSEDAVAKEALRIGYVPLENHMRVGEHATAWYRGPLVPSRTARDFAYGPYHTSDHAMHYDPDDGVFNHAYAAAWQIGRLLALSDANFARELFDWRRSYLHDLKAALVRGEVESRVAQAFGTHARLAPGATLLTHMRELLATDVFEMREQLPAVVPRSERYAQLLSGEEMEAIRSSSDDPLFALTKKIMGRQS